MALAVWPGTTIPGICTKMAAYQALAQWPVRGVQLPPRAQYAAMESKMLFLEEYQKRIDANRRIWTRERGYTRRGNLLWQWYRCYHAVLSAVRPRHIRMPNHQ